MLIAAGCFGHRRHIDAARGPHALTSIAERQYFFEITWRQGGVYDYLHAAMRASFLFAAARGNAFMAPSLLAELSISLLDGQATMTRFSPRQLT